MNKDYICWVDESDPGPKELTFNEIIDQIAKQYSTSFNTALSHVKTVFAEFTRTYPTATFGTHSTQKPLMKNHGPRSGSQFDLRGNRKW